MRPHRCPLSTPDVPVPCGSRSPHVQRSTVSAITRNFQTAGLITQGRGVITIIDRAGLEEAACECYGTIRRSFERLLPRTYTSD
jgi:hypothetical protein